MSKARLRQTCRALHRLAGADLADRCESVINAVVDRLVAAIGDRNLAAFVRSLDAITTAALDHAPPAAETQEDVAAGRLAGLSAP